MAAKKVRLTTEAQEKARVAAVAQRAVEALTFLPIHGFISDRAAESLASRIRKYLWENKLILVEKKWRQYAVLPADARLYKGWTLKAGRRAGIRTK